MNDKPRYDDAAESFMREHVGDSVESVQTVTTYTLCSCGTCKFEAVGLLVRYSTDRPCDYAVVDFGLWQRALAGDASAVAVVIQREDTGLSEWEQCDGVYCDDCPKKEAARAALLARVSNDYD